MRVKGSFIQRLLLSTSNYSIVARIKKAKLCIRLGDKVSATVTTCIYFGYDVSELKSKFNFPWVAYKDAVINFKKVLVNLLTQLSVYDILLT